MSDECMIREYEKREKNGEMRGVLGYESIDINFEGLILINSAINFFFPTRSILRPIYLYILLSIFFLTKFDTCK